MHPTDAAFYNQLRRIMNVSIRQTHLFLSATQTYSVRIYVEVRDRRRYTSGIGNTLADARRVAMSEATTWLKSMSDAELGIRTFAYSTLARAVAQSQEAIAFAPRPPDGWFDTPQMLGVDFEGTPPSIVQLSCASGTVVDRLTTRWIQEVLWSAMHTHAVFGRHELRLVANGWDVQAEVGMRWRRVHPKQEWSLVDAFSLACQPDVRLRKDKTIHRRVSWEASASQRQLSEEAFEYAVCDAWVTRQIALAIV